MRYGDNANGIRTRLHPKNPTPISSLSYYMIFKLQIWPDSQITHHNLCTHKYQQTSRSSIKEDLQEHTFIPGNWIQSIAVPVALATNSVTVSSAIDNSLPIPTDAYWKITWFNLMCQLWERTLEWPSCQQELLLGYPRNIKVWQIQGRIQSFKWNSKSSQGHKNEAYNIVQATEQTRSATF
jgi:hypothetical protein